MKKNIVSALMFFFANLTHAQKEMYCAIDIILPTIDLSCKSISQQLNVSLGYSPVDRIYSLL